MATRTFCLPFAPSAFSGSSSSSMRVLTGDTASNFPSRRELSETRPRDGEAPLLLSFFRPKTLEKNEGIIF